MSAILNQISEAVKEGTKVSVMGNPQYGKYPVYVEDITNSITKGWKLLYRVNKSTVTGKAQENYGSFSELHITNFNKVYTLIQQVYSQFSQGVNVEQRYNNNYATYEIENSFWCTAFQKENSVDIKLTVTDENSPFYLVSIKFVIAISKQSNAPYLVGYDHSYNQADDTFVERFNAIMIGKKKPYVPIYKNNGISTIKASGKLNQQGFVEINEAQTNTVYLQSATNKHQLLAAIYEKAIINLVIETSNEYFEQEQNTQMPANSPFNIPQGNPFAQPSGGSNSVPNNNPFQQNMVNTNGIY